jgi:uncharacterized protein with PIN domain
MLRFHLDEHVHPAIAAGLRARGIDVTTTADADLLSADDDRHLDSARREGRVIVTHDDDFLRMHVSGAEHSGVAYSHRQKYSIGQLLQMLLLLDASYRLDEMRGRVEYL